jgi:succinate dehydrogenase / fumarate reductase flavoprotein subunit
MERYDPQRLELSTRDRVALANYTEIQEGRGGPHGGVFLDITHLPKEQILERLPRMHRQFIEHQMLDISRDRMEVAPTAHYSMGGVVVDPETHATDVAGLFAAGECTGGLHGANRLGGNSLTETIVYGRRAGAAAVAFAFAGDVSMRPGSVIRAAADELDDLVRPGTEMARQLQRDLRDLLWECCGVVRDEEGLAEGLTRLAQVREAISSVDVRFSAEGWTDPAHVLDLRAGTALAEATLAGASARRETRGCHNRRDHPDLDPALQVSTRVALRASGPQTWQEPVGPPPEHLRPWVEETVDFDWSERLVE